MKSSEFITEHQQQLEENLRDWFKDKWVRFGPDGKIRGDCARGSESEGKPKCLPQAKAHALGKKGRASAAARKRRQDPDADRRGSAINVATKKKTNEQRCPHCGGPLMEYNDLMEKKDACYYKVKASAKVWPSAYASGRLVQCRKKGAGNYGNKSESAVTESNTLSPGAVRKIQQVLNKKYNANLDVDGVLGTLTRQSIEKYMPSARQQPAPDSDRTTRVQGFNAKDNDHRKVK
jgi:hypothetical protein